MVIAVTGPKWPKKSFINFKIEADCIMGFKKKRYQCLSNEMDLIVKSGGIFEYLIPEGEWFFMIRQRKPKRTGTLKCVLIEGVQK